MNNDNDFSKALSSRLRKENQQPSESFLKKLFLDLIGEKESTFKSQPGGGMVKETKIIRPNILDQAAAFPQYLAQRLKSDQVPEMAVESDIFTNREPAISPSPVAGAPQVVPKPKVEGKNPEIKKLQGERYQQVKNVIQSAAQEFGVDPDLLQDIAFAESSLDPSKQSNESSAGGLFQFIDSSWKQMMQELGLPENTPKTNPEANARAAALALAKGRINWWETSRWNWGRFHNL